MWESTSTHVFDLMPPEDLARMGKGNMVVRIEAGALSKLRLGIVSIGRIGREEQSIEAR